MLRIRYFIFLFFVMLPSNIVYGGEIDLQQTSIKINDLLFNNKINEAEPLTRECIKAAPNDIYFLSRLEIILNAQNKFKEADELSKKIHTIWEKSFDETDGKNANTKYTRNDQHLRVIGHAVKYTILGAEFFQHVKMKWRPPLFNTYLVYTLSAFPKSEGSAERRFVLEKNHTIKMTSYLLKEYLPNGEKNMFFLYDAQQPHIREVANDVIEFLNEE